MRTQDLDLVFELTRPGPGGFALLAVGGVKVLQVPSDVLGDLLDPLLQLGRSEVLVAGVHRLELAAVHRRDRLGEEADLTAQHYEVGAGGLDRRAIVSAEVRDGLVIRRELAGQPHQLDVPLRLPLQPTARLHPVEIAIDVELQQRAGVIGGPPRGRRHDLEAQARQIELVHEDVDDPGEAVLTDVVI